MTRPAGTICPRVHGLRIEPYERVSASRIGSIGTKSRPPAGPNQPVTSITASVVIIDFRQTVPSAAIGTITELPMTRT